MDRAATLLGDIGGTTARFAVVADRAIGPVEHIPVADHASAQEAIGGFLRRAGRTAGGAGRRIDAAVLGVAGPVEGERSTITNSHWVIDAGALGAAFDLKSVKLINDFEAVAWALPQLGAGDIAPVAPGKALPNEPMAVLGPGTGLGMAALVRCGKDVTVIATEGGHATLPGTTSRENAVIAELRRRFGHASAERALSGSGLENLYAAITAIDGRAVGARSAAEITAHGLDGSCETCAAALDMFCALLGTVAGNLALMFRARGGVYIAGGVALHFAGYLAKSEFRERFVAKGRFRPYLETIPVALIVNPDAAFLGLRSLADAPLAASTHA